MVNKFNDLVLQLGFGMSAKDIFCTGIHGTGIKSGNDFKKTIYEHLHGADLVIQFITEDYKQSEICLNEMGASWVLCDNVVPLIASPFTFDVGFIHASTQQILLNNKEHLLKLYDDFKGSIFPNDSNTNRRLAMIEEFIDFAENAQSVKNNTSKNFLFGEQIELKGTLTMSFQQWPPGDGDPSEFGYNRIFYLQITPTNFMRPAIPIKENDIDRSIFGVEEVQIFSHTVELINYENKHVKIIGEFFTGHTHWHVRDILVDIEALEVIS